MFGEGERDVEHEERDSGEQGSDQQTTRGHESTLHEAAPRSLFPQVDDQQAENEGLKKIGSNEAEPASGRDMRVPVSAPTSSVNNGTAVTGTTNRATPICHRIVPAKSRRTPARPSLSAVTNMAPPSRKITP